MNSKQPIIVLACIVTLCSVVFFVLPAEASAYERFNISLLLLTALVVSWYTVETYFLRVIAIQQLELQNLPSLIVDKPEDAETFYLQNVGNGVAVNIKFDDAVLSKEFGIALRFPRILSLLPRDSSLIKIVPIREGKSVNFPFTANIDQRYATAQHEIMVTFEDIAQHKYRQKLQLGIDGPYVGEIERIK